MHDAHSSMNNPTAHTYNTTAGTTLTQIINQSGGHAPLRTNDNNNSSSNWFLVSSSLAISPISLYFSGNHLIFIAFVCLVLYMMMVRRKQINLFTLFRQLFVTCYVHTTNSTTLCVMQWMQLFLPCNEMPASGPCPLHCSELAYLVYSGMINEHYALNTYCVDYSVYFIVLYHTIIYRTILYS